ncbi:MAG TPA: cyclic nucleotide-binding domain-containing protein [Gaiellaceae bacterium]|nr:cyclic nucleotide-binding domain-containing protein [Gaiellaceae bacterium]
MPRNRPDGKLEALRGVPLFAALNKRELASIGQIADEIDIPAGKELIREDEPGRQFFVVLEGEAVVRRKGRKINAVGAGDFLGEIALLSNRPTTATVTTTTPIRLAVITRTNFSKLLRENPGIQLSLLKTLAERLPN